MPILNELQIVDDFLTAVAPKLNDNANLNEPEMLLSISAITPGAIPTCETSEVEAFEGTLLGELLYGHMQSIFLAPSLTVAVPAPLAIERRCFLESSSRWPSSRALV